ncbi:MAG: DUF4190 domain-containing protein [Acutalibacteraceae bacterium]|nr:DUF4190 domain-containing protein [Acutalibacteraceae bacterium]
MMENNEFNNQQSAPANTTNGMAIAALVCGILGIVGSFIPVIAYFTTVLAILGIIFGAKGKKQADLTNSGKGIATAGLVLGIIGTVFGLVGVICTLACAGAVASAGLASL